MKEFNSCKIAIEECISKKYFAIAHLHSEEKTMNMHIHDCYEIYFSISGGKQFLIGNKAYKIQPGDLFFINQYESHYITQINQMEHERIVLSIHPDFLKELCTLHTDLQYCFHYREPHVSHRIILDKEKQQRFTYFIHKITTLNGYAADVLERALFTELMVLLNKTFLAQCREDAEEIPSSCQYDKQVDLILEYMNQNIHQSITMDELASKFYLSKSYICRIFKASTGTTVNKYLTARRISTAKVLLTEGKSINEVWERCGFHDYSNFLKAFTKAVGISPKKYALYSTK
ncbi:MAG: transcriptional regulator, AraC family [Herbinix sp.]|jgi:AraC-like DNA-binding protein|nr:transcriptional regulator, AraC family [Herbinix sp.]